MSNPHPVISLSLISASLLAFIYNYSPAPSSSTLLSFCQYSLRKVSVPDSTHYRNCFWFLTSPVEFDAERKQAAYRRGDIYLVKNTTLVAADSDKTFFQMPLSDSYTLQRCAAVSGNYIESNSERMRRGQTRVASSSSLTHHNPFVRNDDESASFRVDEHRLLMLSQELWDEFETAKKVGKERRRIVETEMLPQRTMGQFVAVVGGDNDDDVEDEISPLKMMKATMTTETESEKGGDSNSDDDSPMLLKNHCLTWKSQVHEQPKYLLLFDFGLRNKSNANSAASRAKLTSERLKSLGFDPVFEFSFFGFLSVFDFQSVCPSSSTSSKSPHFQQMEREYLKTVFGENSCLGKGEEEFPSELMKRISDF